MKSGFFVILLVIPVLFIGLTYQVYGDELKVLESQLNKNSITGVVQNPYNYTVGGMTLRAEFYNKDGSLVGLRDFGYVTKDELKPNEKSTYKIYEHAGETKEFPKTGFIVKADGIDFTNAKEISNDQLIGDLNNLSKTLKGIPNVVSNVIVYENGTRVVTNVTELHNSTER
jgi:hypothetical protein